MTKAGVHGHRLGHTPRPSQPCTRRVVAAPPRPKAHATTSQGAVSRRMRLEMWPVGCLIVASNHAGQAALRGLAADRRVGGRTAKLRPALWSTLPREPMGATTRRAMVVE